MDLIRRLLLLVAWIAASPASAQDKFIVVASTTSTEQSGLFGHILPVFQKKTGIQVRVVALGTGQGMGPALNAAAAIDGYILADRGTWISFKNRGNLVIAVEGDKQLFNQYGIMLVNPLKHPNVKKDLGQAFVDWVISPDGQKAIADYKIGGEQLFFPNAK